MHSKQNDLKSISIFILSMVFVLTACQPKRQRTTTPWGEEVVVDDDGRWVKDYSEKTDIAFDLDDIVHVGELIALTISGPHTCYDYHGSKLGTHVMLCQMLADSLGVRLRIELCHDTVELYSRLQAGEADLIAYPMTRADSMSPGWVVSPDKPQLTKAIRKWYNYQLLSLVEKEEQLLLSSGGVKRRVFSPMLNQKKGVISSYDALFRKHSQLIHWDWRLMAAQCYQESTFDPNAKSWAGARGLMQIMPTTADHLGLSRSNMNDPEQNIAAAARYLVELEKLFSDIPSRRERQDFVLAAYNGGSHHIRDAMALAKRDGLDVTRWKNVSPYVLRLSQPEYYQDPIVKHGYMRGSETVDYVHRIGLRYQQYRGVRGGVPPNSTPQKSRNERHRKKFKV